MPSSGCPTCGRLMHRVYHSWYKTWVWKCADHGFQHVAEHNTDQLTLEGERGWR